jgi:hypothetical protein
MINHDVDTDSSNSNDTDNAGCINSNNYMNSHINRIDNNFINSIGNENHDDYDSWRLQGIRLMKSQQYDQAQEIFTKLLAVNLDHSIFTYRA